MSSLIPVLSASALSMSSREIADLTGKQHKHVIRDIKALVTQIHEVDADGPDLDHLDSKGIFVVRDERNYISSVALDKDHTLTLLTGYDAKARFRVVKRWQELETQAAPALPQSFAAALQLAADQQRIIEQRDAQLISQQPAVVFHDQVTRDSETLVDWAQAFSLLQRKTGQCFTRRTFLDFLRRHGIACQENKFANISRDRFKPRKGYVNTWFVAEMTPTKGTEWMMRPYAIQEIVRLIEKERMGTAMVAGYLTAGGAA